jgi:hypothetical protein
MQWHNQDIVRLTFKAFHDVLKSQGEAIKVREGCCARVGANPFVMERTGGEGREGECV